MPADLQALMQTILARMPANAPPTLGIRQQQVWAGRMKQAGTAAATPLAGMPKGGQAQVFADFSKALESITKTVNRQDRALETSLKGAVAFAKSPLAKALGLSEAAGAFVRSAKGQSWSDSATAQTEAGRTPAEHQKGWAGVREGAGEAFEGARTGRGADAGAGLAKTVGAFAGLFGKAGKPFQTISKFGEVGFGIVSKVQKWNADASSADMRLAEMGSGDMASVMANSQVQRMLLAQRAGTALAPSSARREAASLAAEQAWQPVTIAATGMWNDFITKVTRGLGVVGRFVQNPGEGLQAAQQAQWRSEAEITAGGGQGIMERWVQGVNATQWYNTHGVPARFPLPPP